MTLLELYRASAEQLHVMYQALDASMRSENWDDNAVINGMRAIDWAEHVHVAYTLKKENN